MEPEGAMCVWQKTSVYATLLLFIKFSSDGDCSLWGRSVWWQCHHKRMRAPRCEAPRHGHAKTAAQPQFFEVVTENLSEWCPPPLDCTIALRDGSNFDSGHVWQTFLHGCCGLSICWRRFAKNTLRQHWIKSLSHRRRFWLGCNGDALCYCKHRFRKWSACCHV